MKNVLQFTLAALVVLGMGACKSNDGGGGDGSDRGLPKVKIPDLPKIRILSKEAPAAATINFETQVRPILETRCLACHNSQNARRGLNLETNKTANSTWQGGPVIMPGEPDRSMLYQSVLLGAGFPNNPHNIPAAERHTLRIWIQEGAYWPDGKLTAR
ncbi:MAG: c-type cytochrome domain-containing protein [Verrucomicrobiota bacterium]